MIQDRSMACWWDPLVRLPDSEWRCLYNNHHHCDSKLTCPPKLQNEMHCSSRSKHDASKIKLASCAAGGLAPNVWYISSTAAQEWVMHKLHSWWSCSLKVWCCSSIVLRNLVQHDLLQKLGQQGYVLEDSWTARCNVCQSRNAWRLPEQFQTPLGWWCDYTHQ